ncbi:hypothetical protein GGR90_003600 [Sphingopyxis italica]|uniref:Uncharacterized protein n=1 Tax=Sphingopyxis italica TaxID=1129133 RepID=A0A7X5XU73_9SPHN|nr:PLP-dependent transferase [Sphingopyxis italica]NJB91389.1 hypothetical protein [Sphingopyxis italica]
MTEHQDSARPETVAAPHSAPSDTRFDPIAPPIALAEFLGGVESPAVHPATTHVGMGVAARAGAGIDDDHIRLEAEADLLADLKAGLPARRM